MKYWFGNGLPYTDKYDTIMDCVNNYREYKNPKRKYKANEVFVDSGAFAFTSQRGERLPLEDLDHIIDLQKALKPDYCLPLDYPSYTSFSENTERQNWEKTMKSTQYWIETSGMNVVPVLHAWNKTNLIKNIRWLDNKCNADYIGLGGIFIHKKAIDGRRPSKALVDAIMMTVDLCNSRDIKIHGLGFGSSPTWYHMLCYMGLFSTDSAAYIQVARQGRILLQGTAERYIGTRKQQIKRRVLSNDEKRMLELCECPVCEQLPQKAEIRMQELDNKMSNRVLHNKWIIEMEEKVATTFMHNKEAYKLYINKLASKSSLIHVWKYILSKEKNT